MFASQVLCALNFVYIFFDCIENFNFIFKCLYLLEVKMVRDNMQAIVAFGILVFSSFCAG